MIVPTVSRMSVPVTTKSQPAAFRRATCEEKSVAPRLKLVFSTSAASTVLSPASTPRRISRPYSSSW
ncbi:hypothetical protein D3C85_1447860 [compost metagenome]